MSDEITVRSYHPRDFDAIKKIHDDNALDFSFPNLNSPAFAVNKVLLTDGKLRASYALRLVAEVNLWLDRSNWADAEQKWLTVKTLDKEAMEAAKDFGLDAIQCFLPPGYNRFGKRISGKDGLGFTQDREGWVGYGKLI